MQLFLSYWIVECASAHGQQCTGFGLSNQNQIERRWPKCRTASSHRPRERSLLRRDA